MANINLHGEYILYVLGGGGFGCPLFFCLWLTEKSCANALLVEIKIVTLSFQSWYCLVWGGSWRVDEKYFVSLYSLMKYGFRRPSVRRSISARTTGRAKRAVKRAIIPGYGRRGMGWLHPKRALYNRVYRRTTFGWQNLTGKSTGSGCSVVLLVVMVAAGTLWALL